MTTGYRISSITANEGAFVLGEEAYNLAIGATGVGGIYRTSGTTHAWDTINFYNVVGKGQNMPILLDTGYADPEVRFTGKADILGGTGSPIGHIRGDGTGFYPLGTSSFANQYVFEKGENYSGALYAIYGKAGSPSTQMAAKIGIGTNATAINSSGYYEGNFNAKNINQFPISLTVDTGNLVASISTGSGVYTGPDYTQVNTVVGREGNFLTTAGQIEADFFISGITHSILDINGNLVFPDYRVTNSPSFTFSRQDNIDVFGSYTRNFGVRTKIVNSDGGSHTTEFYAYGNTLSIDRMYVRSSEGIQLNQSAANISIETGTISSLANAREAQRHFSRQQLSDTGVSGYIDFQFFFNESGGYVTNDRMGIYASNVETGLDTLSDANFLGDFALNQVQGQHIRLYPTDFGDYNESRIDLDSGIYFKFRPSSKVGVGPAEDWKVGPYNLATIRDGQQVFYGLGNDLSVDNGEGGGTMFANSYSGSGVSGRMTDMFGKIYLVSGEGSAGSCCTIEETLSAGNTATTDLIMGGSSVIQINSYIQHQGDTNTYFGFPSADTIVWYTAGTERAKITDDGDFYVNEDTLYVDRSTDRVGIGTDSPSSPMSIISQSSDDKCLDVYDHGDTSNAIVEVKGTANADGEIKVNSTDGAVSVKLSNESSRGAVESYNAAGDTVQSKLAADANGGIISTKASDGTLSTEEGSDGNKRGFSKLYNAAGDAAKYVAEVDSNDQGSLTIKDSAGADGIKAELSSAREAAFRMQNAGSEKLVFNTKADEQSYADLPKLVFGKTAPTSNTPFEVAYDKAVISANNSNVYSTGSVIVAGSGHVISGDFDFIGGGAINDISGGNFGFIGGGSGHCITGSSYSSSAGGYNNDIYSTEAAFIGGGFNNLIESGALVSAIAGGYSGIITDSNFGFVGGGARNHILSGSDGGVIVGGFGNKLDEKSVYSVVGGGRVNTLSGRYSFIAGGLQNRLSGESSAILAGNHNEIQIADNALVAGNYSKVQNGHSGAFVLSDASSTEALSTGANALSMHFENGVHIQSTSGLFINGNAVSTSETDTLQAVTDRGNTTTTSITSNGLIVTGAAGISGGANFIGTGIGNRITAENGKVYLVSGDITDTDTNTFVTGASFGTSDGVLTLSRNDAATVTVDLDGRFTDNVFADAMNQGVASGDSPTFNGLTVTGAAGISGGANFIGTGIGNRITAENGKVYLISGDVTDTDTNSFVTGATFGTSDGVLTLKRNDSLSDLTVDLDGRFTDNVFADAMNQGVASGDSPTFNSVNITGTSTLTVTGSVKGTGVGDRITLNGTGYLISGDVTTSELGLGTAATKDVGISNTNVLQANSTITDDDFLRVDGTQIEGRSASELVSDIGLSSSDSPTFNGLTVTGAAGISGGANFIGTGVGNRITAENGKVYLVSGDITDTDTNTFVTGASFNTGDGVITLSRNDASTVTADLDGRFVLSSATGAAAPLNVGISNTNVLQANSTIVDNDFLRIDGTQVEGRSASEVLSDIGLSSDDSPTFNGLTVTGAAGISGGANFIGTGVGNRITAENGKVYLVSGDISDTDTNTFVTGASFNTGDGVLTLSRNDAATVTTDLDGRFVLSSATGAAAPLSVGISNNDLLQANNAVVDNDFLRVDGTQVEGRSASEVLSDIGLSSNDSPTFNSLTVTGGAVISGGASFSGNVGIGTDSPAHDLEVTGNIRADSITVGTDTIYEHSINLHNDGTIRIGNAEMIDKVGNDLELYQGKLYIENGGNVGIGTDSPLRRLSVKHDNGTALNYVAEFIGGGSVDDETQINVGNASAAAILGFNNGNGALTGQYGYVGITGAGANYQPIVFKSNNVGIGTTSPLSELDVRGDISGSGNFLGTGVGNRITAENGKVYLVSGDITDTDTNTFITGASFGTSDGVLTLSRNDAATVTVDLDGRFTDNTFADAMNQGVASGDSPTFNGLTVTGDLVSTGPHISGVTGLFQNNVGIGTHDPDQTLHVKGIGMIEDASSSSYGTLQFGTSTTRYIRGNSAELQVGSTIQQLHFQKTNGVAQIASSVSDGTDAIQLLARNVHTSANILEVVNGNAAAPIFTIDYTGNVEVTGNILGTGLGQRITAADGKPYLISGDVAAEADTLQTVTDRGDTTTTNINLSGGSLFGDTVTPNVKLSNAVGAQLNYGTSKLINGGSLVWEVGGTEKFRVNSAGTVGIGTSNPTETLDVRGDTLLSGDVTVVDGKDILLDGHSSQIQFDTTSNFIDKSSDANMRIRVSDNDAVLRHELVGSREHNMKYRWFSGPSAGALDEIMTLSASGRLRIGEDTDGSVPLSTLDVRGDISGSGSFLGTGVGNRITNNHVPYLLSGDVAAEADTLQTVTTRGNTTSTSILSTGPHISGGTGLFSEKVGIGTSDPLGTTHIYTADAGGAIVTNASHDDLIIENNGNCGIQLSSPASSYQYLAFGDTASANAGYIRYYHGDDSMVLRAGADDTVTIKGGEVGIGTTAPSGAFHVVGGGGMFDVAGASTADHHLTVSEGTPTDWRPYAGSTTAALQIQNSATRGLLLAGKTEGNQQLIASDGFDISVGATVGSNDGDIALSISGDGNVGIGTNNPSHNLHVYSAGNAEIEAERNGGAAILTQAQASLGRFGTSSNHNMQFMANNNGALTITTDGNVGIGTSSPTEALELSGNVLLGPEGGSAGKTTPTLRIDGYDEHGIEMGWGTWTKWKISTQVNGPLEFYNTGVQHQDQQVAIGRRNYHEQGNLMVYSTGSVLRAGHNTTSYPVLDIGVQDANAGSSAYRGDAYIDVRESTSTPSRFHFKRDGEFIASGVSVSGDVLGTGVGNRITNNHVPYLLSGDISDTDTNTFVTGASFNTSDGVLTLSRNDAATVTADLDGRFVLSSATGAAAPLSVGISDTNLLQANSSVIDNDFLRIDGTQVEGRSASEVLSDIGAQASLTFGISNTNAVKIDSASVADDEYARFTTDGLESRSTSEVLSDIGGVADGGSPTFNSIYLQNTIYHDGDTDTRIDVSADTIQLATAGTTALTVASNSHVGIGTSSPNAAYKLHTQGLSYATGAVIGGSYVGQSPPQNGLAIEGKTAIGYYTTSNNLGIYGNASVGTSYITTSAPSNGLIVQGNVGVGNNAPQTELDVSGAIKGGFSLSEKSADFTLGGGDNGNLINGTSTSFDQISISSDLGANFNCSVIHSGQDVEITGSSNMIINGTVNGVVTLASGYQPGSIVRLATNSYAVFGNLL